MKEIFTAISRLFWLFKLIDKKNRLLFIIAFVMAVCITVITAYIPQAVGVIIDNFNKHDFSFNILFLIGFLYLISELFAYIKKLCVEKASTSSWDKLVKININHLLHIDMDWLRKQELGGLNARFQRSINGAIKLLKITFMDLLPSLLLIIFAISVALNNNLVIGIIITMVIPIAFIIINRQIVTQKGIRISLNRAIEAIQSKLIELLSGIDTIRASGNEKKQLSRISTYSEGVRSKEFKHHKAMMKYDAIKGLNKTIWNIVVIVIALLFLKEGQISVGQVFTFILLFGNVIKPLDEFHRFLDELSEYSILTGDFISLMDIPQDKIFNIKDKSEITMEGFNNIIEASNFSFGYNGTPILDALSLEMQIGKFYGIVGESGCGKSTFIKNILGFDYGNGILNYKGTNICKLSRDYLTDEISYVSQKPSIITGSFRENILYGLKGHFTDDEIWEAVKKAKIDSKIEENKQGLDYIINPSGSNLSGGQAQRIVLARMFLNRTANLFILDEGTSALDNVTEDYIYKSLFELTQKGKTVISIAHRLDTLKKADNIFVMNKGEIVESGTYQKLSNEDGYFNKLLKREIEEVRLS